LRDAGFVADFGCRLFFGVAEDVGAGFSSDLGVGGGDRIEAREFREASEGVHARLLDEMFGAESVELFEEGQDGEDVGVLHPIREFGDGEMTARNGFGEMDVAIEEGGEEIGLIEREFRDGRWGTQ